MSSTRKLVSLLVIALFAAVVQAQSKEDEALAKKYHITVAELLFRKRVLLAHGWLMGIAFAFLYPFGAIIIRALLGKRYAWKVHASWQILAWLMTMSGFGLGVWLVYTYGNDTVLSKTGHPIIGIIVVAVIFFLPALGWLHHLAYRTLGRINLWTHLHVWLARIVMVAGGINGGLGIWMARNQPKHAIPAYSAVAGFFYLLWLLTLTCWAARSGPRVDVKRHSAGASESDVSQNIDLEESDKEAGLVKERTGSGIS